MQNNRNLSSVDYKIVVLGSSSVGKTSLIHRYCNGTFLGETLSTIGAGFFTHTITIENTEATLLLWDTAGEERFRSVAPSLLRGANGLILVFDLTSPTSFEETNIYLDMFLDTVNVDITCELPVLLMANKADLDLRAISSAQIEAWCSKNKVAHWYEVSAKTGQNVDKAITALVESLLKPVQASDHHDSVTLVPPIPKPQQQCGC